MSSDENGAIITIKLAKIEGPRWDEQKEAVKATGAIFQKSAKTWLIETETNTFPADVLNRLFEIAAEFGTQIKLLILRD
ncbi:MAG TPA: hypothetical protein VNO31_42290 [Umezawaea sp.]|nr:hypothetical protein [Umezawaea sp.]